VFNMRKPHLGLEEKTALGTQKFLSRYTTIDYLFGEFIRDLDLTEIFKGKKLRRIDKNVACIYIGSHLLTPIHELLHAGANKLLGYENQKIVIGNLDGGFLWEKIIPGVTAENLPLWKGGYVLCHKSSPSLTDIVIPGLAPYIMTPIGIYLLLEGKRRKCIPMIIAGCGFVAYHADAVFGDIMKAGGDIVIGAADYCCRIAGHPMNMNENGLKYILAIPGVFVGLALWRYSYHYFRRAVNYIREKAHGIDSTLPT